MSAPAELAGALAGVRLVALDVDGVLTDGRVVYGADLEIQAFDVKDGAGLVALTRAGVEVVWITGRGCESTKRRAQELGAKLHMSAGDKAEVLARAQAAAGCGPGETLAMGDDLPDLAMADAAALFVAPADAVAAVRERADWVTDAGGGRGAVRELCDALLAARG